MSTADRVRTSRDGDQFHYLRAARLCLEMLRPGAPLVMVAVEGVAVGEDIEPGLEVIDLALYEGSADAAEAGRVRYRQFKHSTVNAEDEWTASGFTKTLRGFAGRYEKLVERFGANDVAARFRFEFETNRPIANSVTGALADLAAGLESGRSRYFREKIGLPSEALQEFAKLIRLIPKSQDFLAQGRLLEQDFGAYLPEGDKDAPLKLKDLVTRKATSEFTVNPEITRLDVLDAIGVGFGDLFPAPSLIEVPESIVKREQMPSLVKEIIAAPGATIIQAEAGVGKSVFSICLGDRMPSGSETFVFDCFGNGGYRSASGYRHAARQGLVQLANEMATAGLCDPLIPTSRADDRGYVRAFLARVSQASAAIAGRSADALLCLVIDAADNAQIAADEAQDRPSFPRLLLREAFPLMFGSC